MENKLKWKGICIEPNPVYFKRLKNNRKCHLSNYVIDDKNNKEIKFRIDNGYFFTRTNAMKKQIECASYQFGLKSQKYLEGKKIK